MRTRTGTASAGWWPPWGRGGTRTWICTSFAENGELAIDAYCSFVAYHLICRRTSAAPSALGHSRSNSIRTLSHGTQVRKNKCFSVLQELRQSIRCNLPISLATKIFLTFMSELRIRYMVVVCWTCGPIYGRRLLNLWWPESPCPLKFTALLAEVESNCVCRNLVVWSGSTPLACSQIS